MGLTLRAKKSPGKSIDLGAGGFLRLRQKASQLAGEPWASHYATLLHRPFSTSDTESFYAEFDAKTAQLLAEKRFLSSWSISAFSRTSKALSTTVPASCC